MVININPNRINVPSGTTSKASERRRRMPDNVDGAYTVPNRSDVNHIPAPESLRLLISNAVDALRRGIYWERGTILNLLV